MGDAQKERLAHVLWIGGATDSGKSTVAKNLGQRFGMYVYHFDQHDAAQTSNPEKAKMNLFTRDMPLGDCYRRQVASYRYTLYEIDGSRSAEEMTDLADRHFKPYLATLSRQS